MSKIEALIEQYCQEGVEWKSLGELGSFYGGLSGKTKDDFKDGNAKFISYKNIYSNSSLNINTNERVKIVEGEKQNTIQYGDILFTGSSETPDECGMSSVLTTHTDERLYLNSFCFGFRLNDLSIFCPNFLKHLFRSSELRSQIGKTASGTTRFNVSKARFAKVSIPLPPLPIQEEIVRILDTFTELQAELQARQLQYQYYRDKLLSFPPDGRAGEGRSDVEWKKLGEVAKIKNGKDYKHLQEGNVPVYGSGGIMTHVDTYAYNKPSLLLPRKGSIGNIFYVEEPFWTVDTCYYTEIDENKVLPKYLYYAFTTKDLTKLNTASGAVPSLTQGVLYNIEIPIPPLSEQERIVNILDRFDALVNDLSKGLPAEIGARRKQYEYYRDQLLTFKRKV